MALAPRLDLRQSQSLVMTPQLQQAIKLLALSNLELKPSSAASWSATRCSKRATPWPSRPRETVELPEGAEPVAGPDAQRRHAHRPRRGRSGFAARRRLFRRDLHRRRAGRRGQCRADGERRQRLLSGSGGGSEEALDFDSFAAPDIGLHEHLMQQAARLCQAWSWSSPGRSSARSTMPAISRPICWSWPIGSACRSRRSRRCWRSSTASSRRAWRAQPVRVHRAAGQGSGPLRSGHGLPHRQSRSARARPARSSAAHLRRGRGGHGRHDPRAAHL